MNYTCSCRRWDRMYSCTGEKLQKQFFCRLILCKLNVLYIKESFLWLEIKWCVLSPTSHCNVKAFQALSQHTAVVFVIYILCYYRASENTHTYTFSLSKIPLFPSRCESLPPLPCFIWLQFLRVVVVNIWYCSTPCLPADWDTTGNQNENVSVKCYISCQRFTPLPPWTWAQMQPNGLAPPVRPPQG